MEPAAVDTAVGVADSEEDRDACLVSQDEIQPAERFSHQAAEARPVAERLKRGWWHLEYADC